MEAEAVGDQHQPDHHQKRQRQHHQRRVGLDELRQRRRGEQHDPDRNHDRRDHDRNIVGHTDSGQDRIDRKHQIDGDDLGNHRAEAGGGRSGHAGGLVEQITRGIFGLHRVVDFLGRLPQQEHPARQQDQVAPRESGLEARLVGALDRRADNAEIEERLLERDDPSDQQQQPDPHPQREQQPQPPRALLLVFGQLVGKDRDEDEVVDPEHHFERDQSKQGQPGGGISEQSDDGVHAGLLSDRMDRGASGWGPETVEVTMASVARSQVAVAKHSRRLNRQDAKMVSPTGFEPVTR